MLFACFGLGALLGALAAAARSRASWRALILGAAGFSTAILFLAPVHNAAIAGALLLVIGFCFSTWTANSQSILQLSAPDRLRGRVLGLYLFVFAGLSPVGGLLAAWLVTIGGTELAFAAAGVAGLAVTGYVVTRVRGRRKAEALVAADEPAV